MGTSRTARSMPSAASPPADSGRPRERARFRDRPRGRPPVLGATLALALALALGGCAPFARPAATRFTAPPAALAEVRLDSVTVEAGHLVQPVRLRDARGLVVDLLVKRPAPPPGGPAPRVPLVLLLGGHHAGRDAARVVPDTRGMAVVALSYPYRGKQRLSAFGAVRAAPAIRRAVLDTPPSVRLALDWLWAQPWADTTRVEGVGASLGTPFMTVVAALDPRIGRLWSVHGAGDNVRLLSHNTRRFVRLKPLRSLAVHAAAALVAARDLDADRWIGRVSPRPVVLINATEDERLPRAAVDRLHAAAGEPRAIAWTPGAHVQRNRPEVVRALITEVLTRMAASPPAPVSSAGAAPW